MKEFFSFHLLGSPESKLWSAGPTQQPLTFIKTFYWSRVTSVHLHIVYSGPYTLRPNGVVMKETEWPAKSQRYLLRSPLAVVCQPSSRSVSLLFFTASDYILHLKNTLCYSANASLFLCCFCTGPRLPYTLSRHFWSLATFCFPAEHCRGQGGCKSQVSDLPSSLNGLLTHSAAQASQPLMGMCSPGPHNGLAVSRQV